MDKQVEKWIKRISHAEKKWDDYHELIKKIREYYRNEKNKNKQNIFWSSVETLKPFLYFKAPTPYVERKSKTSNPVEDRACKILENALVWNIENQDFDGVVKYARNDFLISGLGLTYEKLNPTFEKVIEVTQGINELGEIVQVEQESEVLKDIKVETTYLDPRKLIFDCENVSVWEDCEWVAQKIDMIKSEVVAQFGKQFADKLIDPSIEDDDKTETCVYRIWDKKEERVLYLSKKITDEFLRIDEGLEIDGFFPFPKPIFATLANDGLIPTPDYSEIKCLLDELDGVNSRMQLTMKALKVTGAYDGSFPSLANILNKDVSLVEIADFQKLRDNGGVEGFVSFMPIAQYVDTLQALAERRQALITAIYEITGVSDIMRGNSDPNETATAVTKKTNFGTLRNQDRQNDFQRFLTDILKIKAEVICAKFPDEKLVEFAGGLDDITIQAIQLLRSDKIRNLTLGIETDVSFMQSEEMEKTTEAVDLIHKMLTEAVPTVMGNQAFLPLYKQMIDSVVATLPSARQYASAIDATFNQIAQQLAQPQPQQPDPELIKAQAEVQKNQNEFQVKQEANAIKQEEVELKKQAEDNKVMMAKEEAEMQYDLKEQELAIKGATNENITTGYVGAF
jgi:hypothetical protein